MEKINILVILSDHLKTLRNEKKGRVSYSSIALFYFLPLVSSFAFFRFPFHIPIDLLDTLVAVFAIFSALLFSAQVALYGLKPEEPKYSKDSATKALQEKEHNLRIVFFQDISVNISYLIAFSCLSLFLIVGLKVWSGSAALEGAILVAFLLHFAFSLLMVVRRTHIAFKIGHDQ